MYQQIIKLLETLGLINTTSKIYDKPIKEQIMSKKINIKILLGLMLMIQLLSFTAYGNSFEEGELLLDTFTSGNLSDAIEAECNTLTDITELFITEGVLNATDIQWIDENLTNLELLVINDNAQVDSGIESPVVEPDNILIASAFSNHANLKQVIMDSVIQIDKFAFYKCANLINATFLNVTAIGESTFAECTLLVNIETPKVATIGKSALEACENLPTVNFPLLTTVNDRVFYDCRVLTDINMPDITSIGEMAFGSTNIVNVSFPEVTVIGEASFYECENLETIDLPKVIEIGASSFDSCTSLESVSFPNINTIENSTFSSCINLTNVDIPNVTSIGNYAFSSCEKLIEVTFLKVEILGSAAFWNCTSLSDANFINIEEIDKGSFGGNSNLVNLTFGKTPPVLGDDVFIRGADTKTINIPAGATATYEADNNEGGLWYGWAIEELPNNLPTGSDSGVEGKSNETIILKVDDFPFNDLDEHILEGINIQTIGGLGVLEFDSQPIVAPTVITRAELENSDLTFKPDVDDVGVNYGNFTYKVFDGIEYSNELYTLSIDIVLSDTEIVALDKENLEVSFANEEDIDNVLTDLTLVETGDNGSEINWSSNNEDVVSNEGLVTRPSSDEEDATITLTATIFKGIAIDSKDFILTVIKESSDEDDISLDKENLVIGYSGSEDSDSVISNIILSDNGDKGSTIVWNTDNPDYVSSTGVVDRPESEVGNVMVTLTATLTKNDLQQTKVFEVIVIAKEKEDIILSDAEIVALDKDNLEVRFANEEDIDNVLTDLTLVETGDNGSEINWSSNNEDVVSNEGLVTRPSSDEEDATITLTATFFKGVAIDSKDFILTVIKESSDEDDISFDKENLVIGYSGSEDSDSVISNIILSDNGDKGSTIVWNTDNPDYVSSAGVVDRPESEVGNVMVTLTATLTKNDLQQTKVFEVNVIAKEKEIEDNSGGNNSRKKQKKEEKSEVIIVEKDVIPEGSKGTRKVINVETKVELVIQTGKEKPSAKATFDLSDLKEQLEGEDKGVIVNMLVNSDVNSIVGELTGDIIKMLMDYDATLLVKSTFASYAISTQEFSAENLSALFGEKIDLDNIKISIEISKSSDETVKIVNKTAKEGQFTVVAPAIDFEINCSYKDRVIKLEHFNSFVERIIAISENIEQRRMMTGVVLNDDETVSHVLTSIIESDGKYYARMNSLNNSTYCVISNEVEFTDVKNHWAKAYVNDMGSRRIISGVNDNQFQPDRDITRAEFASIIVSALGLADENKTINYSDVTTKHWFNESVSLASQYNLVSGYVDGTFKPNKAISREEAMVMIARAMDIADMDTSINGVQIDALVSGFMDSQDISDWSKKSVALCLSNEIVVGSNSDLNAKDNISRAESATMIMRLLQEMGLI